MRGQEEKKRNKEKKMMRTMMHSCGPSKQQRRSSRRVEVSQRRCNQTEQNRYGGGNNCAVHAMTGGGGGGCGIGMQYLRRPLDKSCSCTTAGCGTEQWPLAGRWQVPRGVGKLDCGVVGDKYRVQRLCWEALGFRPSCDGDEWRIQWSCRQLFAAALPHLWKYGNTGCQWRWYVPWQVEIHWNWIEILDGIPHGATKARPIERHSTRISDIEGLR